MANLGALKATAPLGRPWIVDRPRLLKRIDESPAEIVVLFGPAGYGKTTLARQLALRHEVAWYSCRSSSVDVAKLARGVSAAFEVVVGSDASALAERLHITPRPESESETLADLVVDAVAAQAPDDLWLVIDDYHWLMDDLAAEEFVAKLVSSHHFRTLITTRMRPRWATARNRLYGDYLEIDARELCMTHEEVQAVFQRLERAIPEEALTVAGGWPAVVSLVALADSTQPLLRSEALEEFLATEVYDGLEDDVKRTLAVLAVLPTSDPMSAAAIIGEPDLSKAIGASERRGIITAGTDDRLELHPLIAERLRDRTSVFHEGQHRDIVETAARYYIEERQWDEAFEMIELLSARDLFEQLLNQGLRPSLKQGRTVSIKRWIDFARNQGWEFTSLELAAAEVALRAGLYIRAEAISAALADRVDSDAERTWSRLVAGRAAHLAGREEAALEHYRLARQTAGTPDEARVAAWGELTCATDLELPEALELLSQLEESQLASPDDQLQLACRRLNVATRFGALHILEDVREAEQLLPFVDDPLLRASFLNEVAYAAAISGEYELAAASLDQMDDDARRHRLAFVVPYAQFARSVVLVGRRQFSEAFELLKLASAEGRRTADTFVVASCAAVRARALIALGAYNEAFSAARYDGGRLIRSMRAELVVTRGLAVACVGDRDRALALAAEARDLSRAVEIPVTAACIEAIIASQTREDPSELASVAASTAQRTRYVDSFISAYRGYPELARLIAAIPEHRLWLADVMSRASDHELIRVIGLSKRGNAATHLSPREAEVFQLLRHGLSNKQIAEKLYITEATAKIHVRHICSKLGVRTRTEAVLKTPTDALSDLN